MKFKGLGIAVITPFTKENNVDFHSLEKILEHLISNGTDYLVMLGTTAESVTLSKDEKFQIVETAKRINNNRIPLVVGFGGNNTSQVVSDIKNYNFDRINGILSVSPYYNKPNQRGLFEHYQAISNISPVPIILYNVPGRTSSNISAETTLKLANSFENIVAIKEASGDLNQIMNIIKNKHDSFTVISGDDAITLPLMAIGMEGVISVGGNAFPAKFSMMIKAINDNDLEKAQMIHYQLLDFIDLLFIEGNPCGVKALMNLLGLCEKNVRLPLVPLSEENTLKLRKLLESH